MLLLSPATRNGVTTEDDADENEKDTVAGDDPPEFEGKPNKGGAPSPSGGSLTADSRRGFLRGNESGNARKRMLANMRRIGHAW